jgi:peroxiredoxin
VVKLKPQTQRLLLVTAVTLIVIGIALPQAHGRSRAPALPRGALAGRTVTLASLRGHPVAIAFFAHWCRDCHTEAAALARFYAQAGAGRVIGIAYDDARDAAIAFARSYAWSFPLLDDPTGSVGAAYGISKLPTTVIVNSRGEIVARSFGPETVSRLASELRAAG